MARKLYNFIWVALEEKEQTFVGALQIGFTITTLKKTTPGVILYPALLTPLVHHTKQDSFLELLIATEKTLTPDMVNRQLKISPGLRATKHFDPSPLFGGAGDKIVVEEVDADLDELLESHTKFAGILHPSVVKALESKGITKVWKVKVHASALRDAAAPEQPWSTSEAKFIEYTTAATEPKIRRFVRQAVVGKETHDELIRTMLDARFGSDRKTGQNPIPGLCRYAFAMRGNAVDLARANPNEPIQSYHPVVVLSDGDEFSHANIGHVSDIHMNSRWQILSKTTARVIEYGDGQHEDESPRIGNLLAETNRSFHDVLHRLCGSDADAIIIGGDIIDHIRNAFNAATIIHKVNSVQGIWHAMDLENYTDATYPAGIDLIAFYTLIVDALRGHQKPFFAISGNHDCYVDAFGISPRLYTQRANAGIPADLNLTFYEALLSFGPSAALLVKVGSSFDASWFDWFHLVLSPFNDQWTRLPKQSIVGLGWGSSEDLLDPSGEQSLGHLPRSDDAITKPQLNLLKKAVAERSKRKVILTSHFTFLSFREDVGMFPGGAVGSPGTFNSDTSTAGVESFSRFEMGTFETNRQALLEMLGARQIQCVLTGHSHRRGLHLIGNPVGSTLPALLYDPDPQHGLDLSPLPPGATAAEPAIIVSDSGGPYPRYNRDGEFRDWGSDRPGATLVRVDPKAGGITNVRTIQAGSRPPPRAAVSLDYMDIDKGLIFDNNMMIVNATSVAHDNGVAVPPGLSVYTLLPCLQQELRKTRKIFLRRLVFAAQKLVNGARQWFRIEVNCSASSEACPISPEQTADFRTWLKFVGEPTRFVSIQLGSNDPFLAGRYDWNSFWNFEVEAVPKFLTIMKNGKGDLGICYQLKRPSRELEAKTVNKVWREVPAYDWRTANDPKYAR